jgi:hypothetical protein
MLKFLALQGAPCIYDISRLRVKGMTGEKGLKEEDWTDRNNIGGRLYNC